MIMSRYHIEPEKRFNLELTNMSTGEVNHMNGKEVNPYRRYIPRSMKMAEITKRKDNIPALEDLVDLSKPAQRFFFGLAKGMDKYGRLDFTLKSAGESILGTSSSSYISQLWKELEKAGFVGKIGDYRVINPLLVAPQYDPKDPNRQWRIQQIWKREHIDKDVWYEGINEEYEELFKKKHQ